ncbi:transposase [Streptomyces sp. NBC_01589]|uniref:transposase n=1 Tax=unclassified Streptomyces TaxID=2593676 RepID=UPI00386420DA
MTDAEWAAVRDMIPVPAWGEGRGGRPEEYCHRDILDAVRYLVDNGVKWPSLHADYLLDASPATTSGCPRRRRR